VWGAKAVSEAEACVSAEAERRGAGTVCPDPVPENPTPLAARLSDIRLGSYSHKAQSST